MWDRCVRKIVTKRQNDDVQRFNKFIIRTSEIKTI